MRIDAVIPARSGSKGVNGKNLKLICGKPLIYYTIKSCLDCSLIGNVVVSTDGDEIADIARSFGADVLKRPKELAGDLSTDYDVLNHYFENYEQQFIAYMRPTTPQRDSASLEQYILYFFEHIEEMTGLRSVHELPEPPYKMFKIDENGYCCGFFDNFNGIKDYTNLPRQIFPKAYQPNGYIDIVKLSTIKEKKSEFGERIMAVITKPIIEVDTQYEFDLLNFVMEKNDSYKK